MGKTVCWLEPPSIHADHLKDMVTTERKLKEEYNQPRDELADFISVQVLWDGKHGWRPEPHTRRLWSLWLHHQEPSSHPVFLILLGTGRARSMQNIQEKMEKTRGYVRKMLSPPSGAQSLFSLPGKKSHVGAGIPSLLLRFELVFIGMSKEKSQFF